MKKKILFFSSLSSFLAFLLSIGSVFVLIESLASIYLGDKWFTVFSLLFSNVGVKFHYIFLNESKGFMDYFVFGIFVLLMAIEILILAATSLRNIKSENVGLNIASMVIITVDTLAYSAMMFSNSFSLLYSFCLLYRIILLCIFALRLRSIKRERA